MTWAKLLANNNVTRSRSSKLELDRLRSIVARSLTDVAATGLSADSRFIMAYDAARTLSLMIVRASGYRPRTVGGHYNTFLALEAADSAFAALSAYFDGCRIKRNASEYDYYPARLFDGARGCLDHPGDGAGVGDVDGVARLEHGHLRPGALGHPPRELGVERAVLGGDDGVARLVAPGRGGQLGVEGSARYRHLRARHELGLRLGQIGAKVGGELRRIEEDETVLGRLKIVAHRRHGGPADRWSRRRRVGARQHRPAPSPWGRCRQR